MSTSKDKSQGPYTVQPHSAQSLKMFQSVKGPTYEETLFDSEEEANDLADALNAAYSAGQADLDELVKAFREVLSNYKHAVKVIGIPPENMSSIDQAEIILSRYPNPLMMNPKKTMDTMESSGKFSVDPKLREATDTQKMFTEEEHEAEVQRRMKAFLKDVLNNESSYKGRYGDINAVTIREMTDAAVKHNIEPF